MSAGFSSGTGGGGEASLVSSAGNSKDIVGSPRLEEGAGEQQIRTHDMHELAASLGTVAQAGREHGLYDTVTVYLPTTVLDRANEIHQDLKSE